MDGFGPPVWEDFTPAGRAPRIAEPTRLRRPYPSVGAEISSASATSMRVLGTAPTSSARPRGARPSCGGALIWNRNQTIGGSERHEQAL